MPNYYDMLRVKPDASQDTIKNAFRRLVKEYHPDLNRNRKRWAEAKFKGISQAYKTLSNDGSRLTYDRVMFGGPAPAHPDFTNPYRRAQRDVAFQVRRVLADLLHGRGQRGVLTYERLCREVKDFALYNFMSLKDYLDTVFLLAEQYEAQGRMEEALALYLEVYKEESQGPRLRYFYDEVSERIVAIYCRHLARKAAPREAIGYYQKAAKIDQSNAARSQIYMKMAEQYCDLGERGEARRIMRQALHINPRMKGARRLCRNLGIPYSQRQRASEKQTADVAAKGLDEKA